MKKISITYLCATLGAAWMISPARAQQPVVYPAHGQSAQQQSTDEGACYAWAKQHTGIDPAAAAAPPPQAQAQNGQRVRGAAAGAAMGATAGAIGGDAGHGAAVGAVAGTVAGGMAHRQQARAAAAQNAQTQSMQQQALSTYNQSWAACMQGRGYSVR
ncbi:YMGG-like glycine zipper-containing protein [Paraburkholderia acidipaludis]|uniref:YMGG-like glycine zipper-containing protein n=1 Tax=Paraburkholderia acidipaludis TaxID=660537 RepID=UPI000487A802